MIVSLSHKHIRLRKKKYNNSVILEQSFFYYFPSNYGRLGAMLDIKILCVAKEEEGIQKCEK